MTKYFQTHIGAGEWVDELLRDLFSLNPYSGCSECKSLASAKESYESQGPWHFICSAPETPTEANYSI